MGANDLKWQGTINENGDCECETKTEYCNDCADLRDNSSDFYVNGVTDRVCESLENNQGFSPDNDDDNCSALHKADNCLINTLIDKLPAYDVCDWKEFMEEYLPNQFNMNEAIICAICGINKRLFAQQLDVELRWLNEESRPGDTLSVDKQGNFRYDWTDWVTDGQTPYGKGFLTGKVNFCMKELSGNKAQYNLQSVTIKRIKWDPINPQLVVTHPVHTLRVPDDTGAVVWKKELLNAVDETINRQINLGKKGEIAEGSNSQWINILWKYGDWVLDSEHQLQIRFKNGNSSNTVPMCE